MTGRPKFLTVGVVGAAATVTDLVGTALATRTAGTDRRRLATGDLLAVGAATVVSVTGHRRFTFADEPSLRWYRNGPQIASTAVAAAVVDAGVFTALVRRGRSRPLAKIASVTAAFGVRAIFYRRVMFRQVRADQQAPQRSDPAPGTVRLSVVVPAYGEEHGIGATVERLRNELADVVVEGGVEIVVVDDGSNDDTAGAAKAAGADLVIRFPVNRGKGAAVRAGMLAATGRTICFTDADLSYAPHQIVGLLEAVEAGWDVVVGSRRHTETRTLVQAGRLREIGGRVINVFTMVVLLGQYRDTQCGLKAFRSDVAREIFSSSTVDGFAFDVEVFHLVERRRLSLLEVPVEVTNSSRSTVNVARDASRLVRDLAAIRRRGRAGDYGR